MTLRLVVHYSPAEVERLRRSVARQRAVGGFQALQRYHLQHLTQNVVIIDDPVWIERTVRYATRYGEGGWQSALGRKQLKAKAIVSDMSGPCRSQR